MAFEIIASINTAGSIKEISNKLSNEVANGVNSKMPLKIVATIDTQKTISQINNSLNSLSSGISIKNINIDGNAITGAKDQLKNIATKDVDTIQKVAIEDLKAFENQIKNSKVPIREMKEDLKQLNETLSKPLNKEELTNYLNTFDVAKSKFKALMEQYKVSESEAKKYYDRIKENLREINKIQTQKLKVTSPEEIKLLDEQLKRLKSRLSYNEKQISKKKLENNEMQREVGILKSQYEWEQNLLKIRIKNSNIKNQNAQENKSVNKFINDLTKQSKVLSELQVKQLSLKEGTEQRLFVEKQLAEAQKQYNNILSSTYTTKGGFQSYYAYYNEEITTLIKNLEKLRQKKLEEAQARLNDNAIKQQEVNLKNYSNSIDGIISKLNSTSQLSIFNTNSTNVSVVATRESIADLINRFEKLKSTMGTIKTPEQFKDFQNKMEILNNEFIKVYSNAKNLQNQFRSDNSATALGTKIQTLRTQIEKYMNTNTKAMNNSYKNQFDELLNSLRNVSNTNEFNKIKQKFQDLTVEIDRLGLRGMSVMDTLKQKLSKFASWMGLTMVTASVAREIRGMYSTVAELDTALVDLNKTFQGTSADLEDFYYGANKVAKQLGSTTKEIIDSASSWSRLGYSNKESALQMAETSSIFASVSPDMDLEQATTSLTSILKAYKDYGITTENALDEVVSKINQIGNKFAVTNGNISTGLQKSASSMALAGVTFDKAVSLFTSAQEIVQDDDSVGK